ncbi:unnamed protein product, partial [Rotaria magnacalcarata]
QTSYSPLYIACRIGNLEIVHTILTHFPHLVCVATLEQILPFAAACSQGHLPIVQLLLTYPNYPFSSCSVFIDRLQRSYVFPFNLNGMIYFTYVRYLTELFIIERIRAVLRAYYVIPRIQY